MVELTAWMNSFDHVAPPLRVINTVVRTPALLDFANLAVGSGSPTAQQSLEVAHDTASSGPIPLGAG